MKKQLERLRKWAARKLERARRWAIRKLGGYVIARVPLYCFQPAGKSEYLNVREFWAVDYCRRGRGVVSDIWDRGVVQKDLEWEIMKLLREAGAITWQETEDWTGDITQIRARLVVVMPKECRP